MRFLQEEEGRDNGVYVFRGLRTLRKIFGDSRYFVRMLVDGGQRVRTMEDRDGQRR